MGTWEGGCSLQNELRVALSLLSAPLDAQGHLGLDVTLHWPCSFLKYTTERPTKALKVPGCRTGLVQAAEQRKSCHHT